MAYLIEDKAPVSSQIQSVFSEQIQIVRDGFLSYPHNDPEGLHSARKGLKRNRSMLRLLRDRELQHIRKPFTNELRRIAQQVSVFRDTEVLVATIEKWASISQDNDVISDCESLKEHVTSSKTESFLSEDCLNTILDDLDRLQSSFMDAVHQQITRMHLAIGMEWGKAGLICACMKYVDTPNIEALHDLRKSAKHYMYHQELLAALFPSQQDLIVKIRQFESCMGKARDCDMVSESIMEIKEQTNGKYDFPALSEHCGKEKTRIMEQALSLDLLAGLGSVQG